MFFVRPVQRQACDVEQETKERNNSETFVTEMNQASWILLTNTISHGQTIMYMMVSAIEASKKAVGYSLKIFDSGKNGLQLSDDFAMPLKNEFVLDDPNVIFPYIPFQDDDTERRVEMCSLETYLSHNANRNDEVIIVAGARHIQRGSERKIVPMLCKGDLDFFSNCPVTPGTPASLDTRAYFWSPTKLG